MKTKISKLIMAIMCIAIISTSCKKNEKEDVQQSAADNALAEATFEDIGNQVDQAYDQSASKSLTATCPVITHSILCDSIFPDTIIVDFGKGCTVNGVTRSGRIISTFTGHYRDLGTVITHTLDNFYRNGNHITGTKTVTNNGHNSYGNLSFSISIQNASITTDNGTISWTSTRTREWIKGSNTTWQTNGLLCWLDDVYLITGSASGTNVNGKTFTVTITNPLRVELSCRWIVSGTFEVTPEGGDTRTVDYGDGTCDDQATLTWRKKVYKITLK